MSTCNSDEYFNINKTIEKEIANIKKCIKK